MHICKRFISILVLLSFGSSTINATQSGTIYSILPVSSPTPLVAPNSFGRINYQVVNNSKITRYVQIRGPFLPGYQQITTDDNDCQSPQLLAPGERCNYRLLVISRQLNAPVSNKKILQVTNRRAIIACTSDATGNPSNECSITPTRDEPNAITSSSASVCTPVCNCADKSSDCGQYAYYLSSAQCQTPTSGSTCETSSSFCSLGSYYTTACSSSETSSCLSIGDETSCNSAYEKISDTDGTPCEWDSGLCVPGSNKCIIC